MFVSANLAPSLLMLNDIGPYTFVTMICDDLHTYPPTLLYITLDWPNVSSYICVNISERKSLKALEYKVTTK